jgi:hypothetical protein
MIRWVLVALCVGAVAICGAAGQVTDAATKKIIYYGWGVRDSQYVRDHWQEMEQTPLHGTGIVLAIDRTAWLNGNRSTANQFGWQIMGRRAFTVDHFDEALQDLRTARWVRFTDNFLPASLSSSVSAKGLTWFDNDRWATITSNFEVLAKIAAGARLRGLILDPEHYDHSLFSYTDQRGLLDRSFSAYQDMARQRGAEIMRAVARNLPELVLLNLYGYTLSLSDVSGGKPLESTRYGLLPAFYDGLLVEMPKRARFVDGYEFAYGFKRRSQFTDGHRKIHQNAARLSSVPNDYREKVTAGFGLWLDYRRQGNYFTPVEFSRALRDALAVSDGYVWIYSEGVEVFPPSGAAAAYFREMAALLRDPHL